MPYWKPYCCWHYLCVERRIVDLTIRFCFFHASNALVFFASGSVTIVNDAENLLLLWEFVNFETSTLAVCNITLRTSAGCPFGHVCYISRQSVLHWNTAGDAVFQNLNSSWVLQISIVAGLIHCCTMSIVLNLSIDLDLLTISISNWHEHKNKSAGSSVVLNSELDHVKYALKFIPTLRSLMERRS